MKTRTLTLSLVLSLLCSLEAFAVLPSVTVDAVIPGRTPFISFVSFRISDATNLSTISFQIRPKPGSRTRPLAATYSSVYLKKAGYFHPRTGQLTLPVFGLYRDFRNTVRVRADFNGGTTLQNSISISTAEYNGGTYTAPEIVQARLPDTTLSYDFILLKGDSSDNTPVIIDSDAEVRWVAEAGEGGQHSILFDNAIYYGASPSSLVREDFDGRIQILADYSSLGVVGFHHNADYGRDGIILEVDTTAWTESVNLEVDAAGNVLRTWSLGDIISTAMVAGGDDPSGFVFPTPVDWFHNNATTYRPSDDSLIVSSRENFVIALDYDTGAIKWILGDSAKHWFQYPSLQAFALALGPDTLAPIGEHAVSMVGDRLLLFDNATASNFQVPAGNSRTYSAPRKYSITGNTATEVFNYLIAPPIKSAFCSSVYEDATDNYLIDYTQANAVSTDLVAVDKTGQIAFYYRYVQDGCGSAWNAVPIHLENLQFD